MLLFNERNVRALRPHLQLVIRSSAEGIRSRQRHAAAHFLKAQRQFANSCCLADTVDAYHQHHHWPVKRRARDVHFLHHNLLKQILGDSGVLDLLGCHFFFERVNHLSRRRDAGIA